MACQECLTDPAVKKRDRRWYCTICFDTKFGPPPKPIDAEAIARLTACGVRITQEESPLAGAELPPITEDDQPRPEPEPSVAQPVAGKWIRWPAGKSHYVVDNVAACGLRRDHWARDLGGRPCRFCVRKVGPR